MICFVRGMLKNRSLVAGMVADMKSIAGGSAKCLEQSGFPRF
jgi:hypothetical protein